MSYFRKCPQCEVGFEAERWTRRFCSEACKVRHHNARQRAAIAAYRAANKEPDPMMPRAQRVVP